MKKLINIQSQLKAPKGQLNKFGNYHYRSCEDILEALKPLLIKEGVQLTISDEIVLIGDRYYVKATATVTDGTEAASVDAYAREAEDKKGMDASQITGAASSYARKYALNGLFAIDDTKDADSTNNHDKKEQKKPEPKEDNQDPALAKKMFDLVKIKKAEDVVEYIKNEFKKDSSKDMTNDEIEKTIKWLSAK